MSINPQAFSGTAQLVDAEFAAEIEAFQRKLMQRLGTTSMADFADPYKPPVFMGLYRDGLYVGVWDMNTQMAAYPSPTAPSGTVAPQGDQASGETFVPA
jgi:hypothetical protein